MRILSTLYAYSVLSLDGRLAASTPLTTLISVHLLNVVHQSCHCYPQAIFPPLMFPVHTIKLHFLKMAKIPQC